MKKKLLTLLIALTAVVNSQTKITYDGHDNLKGYFNDHYTKHYEAGLLISGTVGYTMNYFTERPVLSALTGILAGMTAGILKEAVWDKRMGRGVCNNFAAVVTIQGSTVSGIINLIIFDKQRKKNHYAKWLFE